MGLFQDDLVDMANTPIFQSHYDNNLFPKDHMEIDIKKLKRHYLKKIKNEQFSELYQEIKVYLDSEASEDKNQNCLTRHFLESIARSLRNREFHRELSLQHGLEDPQNILNKFLKIQVMSLPWAYSLDRRAFEVQKKNIPLFCRDIPAIEYH